jgi:hypothetical protein
VLLYAQYINVHQQLNLDKMKKIFFFFLAICLLSVYDSKSQVSHSVNLSPALKFQKIHIQFRYVSDLARYISFENYNREIDEDIKNNRAIIKIDSIKDIKVNKRGKLAEEKLPQALKDLKKLKSDFKDSDLMTLNDAQLDEMKKVEIYLQKDIFHLAKIHQLPEL